MRLADDLSIDDSSSNCESFLVDWLLKYDDFRLDHLSVDDWLDFFDNLLSDYFLNDGFFHNSLSLNGGLRSRRLDLIC